MGNVLDLRELYDASYGRLVVQVYAFCGDLTDAEDAVQEAFVAARTGGAQAPGRRAGAAVPARGRA